MPPPPKAASATPELPFPASGAGLRVLAAPRLAPLFEHFAGQMAERPLPPFERETVMVVHNTGLASWIEHQLADQLGCAAAIETVAPRSLADRLVRDYLGRTRLVTSEGDQVMRDPFELAGLTWSIHALLADLPNDPRFDPLRAYLDRAGTGALPLAARLARVFDDYQVYRPELLTDWRRGQNPLAEWAPSAWQMPLWRHLCDAATLPESGEPILDRAAEMQRLIDWFGSQRGRPDGLPMRLTVFGALVFPPIYARMLRAISRFVPVTWYAVLPPDARQPGRQPLRRLLGGQIEEFLAFVQEAGAADVTYVTTPPVAPPDGALQTLQDDILQNRVRQPGERAPLAPDDASLRIHDCHGPLRELEVLRDQILDAFETIPGLRPDEVAIVLADLNKYAPLVDAVFGGGDARVQLPYHIVRNPRGPARRVLEAFSHLLDLAGARVTAPDLLELLDEPAVRRAAGIREDEPTQLREWVRQTHIRWGTDGHHKAVFGLPADDAHTWRHGLDRLILGYAMGDVDEPVLGVLPLAEQSLDRADLLGRFALWTQQLFDALDALRASRELDAWADTLAALLTTAFDPLAEEELAAVRFARQQVADLAQLHHLVPAGGDVAFAAVRSHLQDAIGRYEGHDRVLTGRITVTDYERLRHAPFRVVACAGLNDGTFPRRTDLADFDARALERRPGDYDPRSLDKQLFLDALLAAEDRVILTYTGRSQRDNTERAPSVVLDALLDACRQTFSRPDGEPVERQLVVRHPLQPFSERYFDDSDPRLFSFDAGQAVRAPDERQPVLPFVPAALEDPTGDGELELTIPELAAAWTNPSRYFCQLLGLRLTLEDVALEEIEPLRVEGLEAYAVKDRLLRFVLDGRSDDEAFEHLRASGALPAGELGRAWFRRLRAAVDPLAQAVRAFGPGEPLDVAAAGPGWRLSGRVEAMTDRGPLHFRCARVKAKDLVSAWVTHLALGASGDLFVLGEDGRHRLGPVRDAEALLAELVDGYRAMRRTPPPLFEHASRAFVESGRNWWKATDGYSNDFGGKPCDLGDLHVRLVFRDRDPTLTKDPAFEQWADRLWGPLLSHRHDA